MRVMPPGYGLDPVRPGEVSPPARDHPVTVWSRIVSPGEKMRRRKELRRGTGQNGRVDEARLRRLIDDIRTGATSPDDAVAELRRLPFADVGDALVDHHRALRQGHARGHLRPRQVARAVRAHRRPSCSRTTTDPCCSPAPPTTSARRCWPSTPRASSDPGASHGACPSRYRPFRVLVVSAGTADVPVVDEAVFTLRAYGFDPDRLTDVGVAGLHRLLAHLDRVTSADAIVVVGRHGGRARQRDRRAHRRARSWRCPPASATAPASRASPRCWRCTPRARAASPSSASTTASVRPARWPASSGCPRDRRVDRAAHGLVPLLRRHRGRHDHGCTRARGRRPGRGRGHRRRARRGRLPAHVRTGAAVRHRRDPRARRGRRGRPRPRAPRTRTRTTTRTTTITITTTRTTTTTTTTTRTTTTTTTAAIARIG